MDVQDPSELDQALGAWLAKMREAKGIAQSALAEQLSHDQSYVSRLEAGRRRVTVRDVFAWAGALGATWEEVLAGLNEVWERRELPRSLWEES
jgi:transcriptional regulator with XRE-family HTH domain